MITRITFVILSIFLGFSASAQTVDCYKYKTGKFRIADPHAGGINIIERNANYQVETMDALKVKVRFNVTWVDDCTYTLTIDKILRNENHIDLPRMELRVTIVETTKDGYIQESASNLYPGSYRSTVTRIN